MNRDEATKKLQEIIGEDLVSLAEKYNITLFKNGHKNNGWVGHIVEHNLGLPINSLQSPDFGDWELKTVSMKRLKNGLIVPKETMAITMINPEHVINNDFEHSHLKCKLQSWTLRFIARAGTPTGEASRISHISATVKSGFSIFPSPCAQVRGHRNDASPCRRSGNLHGPCRRRQASRHRRGPCMPWK